MEAMTQPGPRRIAVLVLMVYPALGVAVFWAIGIAYHVLGEEALAWLPGATAVVSALLLPAALTALSAPGWNVGVRLASVLVAVAVVMTVVWFWISWMSVLTIQGSSGEDWYD